MRLTAILLTIASLHVCATGVSQKVTLHSGKVTLQKAFSLIQEQTGSSFLCDVNLLEKAPLISVNIENATLEEALDACLKGIPFTYEIQGKFVYIKPKAQLAIPSESAGSEETTPPATIRGKVMDSTGNPLAGATVMVKGTSRIVQTDQKGEFTIKDDSESPILVVSFTGYATKEMRIPKKNIALFYVMLNVSTNPLDEIQITAYGKTSRRLSTGDITTISGEEIRLNPVPNLLQAIQGRVPGMFITQQTGQPGGAFSVQIRSQTVLGNSGNTSVQLSQPLYMVDGVTYPAGTALPMFQGTSSPLKGGNALNYLDPSMIESVTILKGPDATAIYGSRGASGVIIITTKKGMAGKSRLNIDVYTGTTRFGITPKLLNTQQYLALRHDAFRNDGVTPGPNDLDVNGTWDTASYIDWKKFYQGHAALTTKANVTYTGGGNNSSFLIGANYSDQGNVQRGIGAVRAGGINFNINNTTSDRKFSIVLSGNYSNTVNDMVPFDASGAINAAPDAPSYYLPTGQVNWAAGYTSDNLKMIYRNTTNNLVANTVLTYAPITGLAIKLSGGYSQLSAKEFQANPSAFFNPNTFTTSQMSSVLNYYTVSTLTFDPNISYKHQIGSKGIFDVTVGGTLQNEIDENNSISASGFLSDNLLYDPASAPIANQQTNYTRAPFRYLGFFGVAHYNWDNKYILSLNARRDGSTRFGPGRQFGNFGSVGAAWILSEEKWFKNLRPAIDFAKITGSYGTTGGDAIPNYQFLSTYNVNSNSYQGATGLAPNNPANAALHWSMNKDVDLGIMLRFLKGKISMEGTYYSNRTSDLLASLPLSSVTGIFTISTNSPIVIKSSGLELVLDTKNIVSKNFSWETSINVTVPHSKLVSFPGGPTALKSQFGVNYIIGKPVTGASLYQYNGVDPATGNYLFTDAKGVTSSPATLLSPADYTQFRDLAPKFYGGISNTLKYKRITLSFLFTFTDRIGKNYQAQAFYTPGINNTNFSTLALKRWEKPGDKTNVPKATQNFFTAYYAGNNFLASTGAYTNATYARLSNVNIGYDLSPHFLQKAHIQNMRIYLAGQNLLTISKFGDLDPENMSASNLGPLRVYTGGLTLNF